MIPMMMARAGRRRPTTVVPGDGTTAWENVVNATTGEGTIQRPSGAGWDAGGSFSALPANTDGEVFFRFNQAVLDTMFGLTDAPSVAGHSHLQFSLYCGGSAGRINVWENGASSGHWAVDTSSLYSIRRTGTVIDYLKDGVVFHTSSGVAFTQEAYLNALTHSSLSGGHDIRAEYYR